MDAELDERALVDQQREPLARGQLALLVLAGDLLLAAAELICARRACRSSTSGRSRLDSVEDAAIGDPDRIGRA